MSGATGDDEARRCADPEHLGGDHALHGPTIRGDQQLDGKV